jgi:hypothetical protein
MNRLPFLAHKLYTVVSEVLNGNDDVRNSKWHLPSEWRRPLVEAANAYRSEYELYKERQATQPAYGPEMITELEDAGIIPRWAQSVTINIKNDEFVTIDVTLAPLEPEKLEEVLKNFQYVMNINNEEVAP